MDGQGPGADDLTFEEFFRRFHPAVYRLAARSFGAADAEDIAQETMIHAYRGYAGLSDKTAAWGWLALVTHHAGIDVMRRQRGTVAVEPAELEDLVPPVPDLPTLASVSSDIRIRVGKALRELRPADAVAFRMHEIEGIPVGEVAAACRTTPNAVRQRLHRARRFLAHEMRAVGLHLRHIQWPAPSLLRWPVQAARHVAESTIRLPVNVQDNAAIAGAVLLGLLAGTAGVQPVPGVPPVASRPDAVAPSGPAAEPAVGVKLMAGRLPVSGLHLPGGNADSGDHVYQYTWRDNCNATRGLDQYCTLLGSDGADDPPAEATHHSDSFQDPGGATSRVDVLLPVGRTANERFPVALAVGPLFDDATRFVYPELWVNGHIFDAPRRYAYVQVGLPGRGTSADCPDFGGPVERAQVVAAIKWAAAQPWSNGRVALWGVSYWAWAALMGVAERPAGLAAVVIGAGVVRPGSALSQGGVPLLTSGWPSGHLPRPATDAPRLGSLSACPDAGQAMAPGGLPGGANYWRDRDLSSRLDDRSVPVLWSHGFGDGYATPGNTLAPYHQPHWRGFQGQFGHGFPASDRWFTEAMNWLDQHLGVARRSTQTGIDVQQGPDGGWRTETRWPPSDAAILSSPLNPGRYADTPGNHAEPGSTDDGECELVAGSCGQGIWTAGEPLPYDVHLSGVLTARLSVAAVDGATAVVLAYDIGPDGAVLITRGAALVLGGQASVELYPQDWRIPAGHQLGILVSGSDDSWYRPYHTGTEVDVLGGAVDVPYLAFDRAPRTRPGDIATIAEAFQVTADELGAATRAWPVPPPLRPEPKER